MFAIANLSPWMIPFILLLLYGGGCSVIVDGDGDFLCCRSAHVVIINILSLAVCVFLFGQSEELD